MKHLLLEDSVFLWNKMSKSLFYDSTSFNHVLIEKQTDGLKWFCDTLAKPDNLHSIELDEATLDKETIELIDTLIKKGFAKISDDSRSCAIPPVLLLNGDLDHMTKELCRDYIYTRNLYDYISHFTFFVDKEQDIFKRERELIIEEIKKKNPSFEYDIIPYHEYEKNDDVACDSRINEEAIFSAHINKRRIFIHQKINVKYWGHLFAFPNGEIHPHPTNDSGSLLGWIWEPIIPMVGKELLENHAWRRVRDFSPCKNCVYQWLCPSPTIKERAQGISHVCEVL